MLAAAFADDPRAANRQVLPGSPVSLDPAVTNWALQQAEWRAADARVQQLLRIEGPRQPDLDTLMTGIPRDLLATPPRRLSKPAWDSSVLNSAVGRGPSDRPMVALTIDDGAMSLDETLKVIREEGAGATFFLTGKYLDRRRDFLEQALDTPGVEIGNHTWNHSDLPGLNDARVSEEIGRFEELLADTVRGATSAPYLRPPGGSKSDRVVAIAAALGYRTILWNISGDGGSVPPAQLADLYMRQLDKRQTIVDGKPGYQEAWGSIILLHFRPGTCSVLPDLIRGIRARGMEPVALSTLYEGGRT